MPDREIGYVELTATTRIIFAVGSWKGQSRGSIRKFVTTEKYAGPTKSGMSLDGATVVQLLMALRALQSTIPIKDQKPSTLLFSCLSASAQFPEYRQRSARKWKREAKFVIYHAGRVGSGASVSSNA